MLYNLLIFPLVCTFNDSSRKDSTILNVPYRDTRKKLFSDKIFIHFVVAFFFFLCSWLLVVLLLLYWLFFIFLHHHRVLFHLCLFVLLFFMLFGYCWIQTRFSVIPALHFSNMCTYNDDRYGNISTYKNIFIWLAELYVIQAIKLSVCLFSMVFSLYLSKRKRLCDVWCRRHMKECLML